MLAATAIVLAAMGTAVATLEQDPSLRVEATIAAHTVVSSFGEIVLDHKDIELTWDSYTSSFAMSLGGVAVEDLVTSTDRNGWPSFAGSFSGGKPAVHGSVITHTPAAYDVVITRPGHKPESLFVEVGTLGPVVTAGRECDCSDRITLSCTTILCNTGGSCGTDSSCKWYPVSSGNFLR